MSGNQRKPLGLDTVCCSKWVMFSFSASQDSLLGATQLRGSADKGIEYNLKVKCRATDRPQHISSCRLLLKCFRKLACTSLYLLEKARVFNRDHGLVRKGIDEFDLTFGEWAHFGAPNEDYANCLACVDQRHGERGAPTESERILPALGVFILSGQNVFNVNRSPVDDGTPHDEPTHEGKGEVPHRAGRGNLPIVRDEAQTIAKHLKDQRVIRIAQARCGLDQRIEYFLHVESRPADDLQNIGGGRLLFQAFC